MSVRPRVRLFGGVTLQRFIPLIAPEAPTALVPGVPEPRMYPRSGYISSFRQNSMKIGHLTDKFL